MNKYQKAFLVVVCSTLAALLAYQLFWFVLYSVFTKTTTYSQVVSPDGKTMASVIQVDTGVTSGFNRQVVLTPTHTLFAKSVLHDANNQVMFLNGETNIHLFWHGSKNLVVDYRDNPNPDINYQQGSWHGVSLTYLGTKKWVPPATSGAVTITTPAR